MFVKTERQGKPICLNDILLVLFLSKYFSYFFYASSSPSPSFPYLSLLSLILLFSNIRCCYIL
jgi:hypothetical protein